MPNGGDRKPEGRNEKWRILNCMEMRFCKLELTVQLLKSMVRISGKAGVICTLAAVSDARRMIDGAGSIEEMAVVALWWTLTHKR